MDARLFELRQNSYGAAAEYHRVIGLWCAAKGSSVSSEGVASLVPELNKAAATYGDALEQLMSYLTTLEPTKTVMEEKDRTAKLKELLYRELRLIY
jgi:hypothetical protein